MPETSSIVSVSPATWANSTITSWNWSVCLYAPLQPGRLSAFAPSTWS